MTDPLNTLKNQWDDAKSSAPNQMTDTKALIAHAQKKLKSAVVMHWGNIAVLFITLVGISCYFLFVAPFRDFISHVGIFLMVGGLILRILIEMHSIRRSSRVNMSDAAKVANENTVDFHAYRKRVHGPVTIGILLAYTVGFYLLTPEFADYFTTRQVILLDASYLLAAAIFGYSIRTAIKKEMKLLDEMKDLQAQLSKE